MNGINFQRTYQLNEDYENITNRAFHVLRNFLKYPSVVTFNCQERSVTFTTERLIPVSSTNRLRVLLLFSNPHPYSIHQGMFLSPNAKGRASLFWSFMEDAGWIPIPEIKRNPEQLADICLKAEYGGPFEFVFYCYYSFPTAYPEDISRIFGKEYFSKVIESESETEFRKTIQETSVEAVVTFNKGIFNLVSKDRISRYIERLMDGKLIQSQINNIDKNVPIFLTFPTGWRYHRDYRHFHKTSLDNIKTAICNMLNLQESKND